jgi:hypothetical protein
MFDMRSIPRLPRERQVDPEDVFEFVIRNPGAYAGDIADGLGCAQQAVLAHLRRGRGIRFSTQYGCWYPIPR